MKAKISLPTLVLAAAALTLPVSAQAGFTHRDHAFWTSLDARVRYLASFEWLCHDRGVVTEKRHHKMRKAKRTMK